MRRRMLATKLFAAVGVIAAALLALAAPASAGTNMHVDVHKVVVGTAPPGTTFTVHFDCTDGGPDGDLTFDATGKPVPADSNFFNDGFLGTTCTLTEPGTGGATGVSISCQDDGVNASCSSSGDSVTFDSPTNLSNQVDFTVTNTFGEPTPTTTGPTAAVPEPAVAVVSVPVFTG
jgi:Domain of unknown function (DUF5979)